MMREKYKRLAALFDEALQRDVSFDGPYTLRCSQPLPEGLWNLTLTFLHHRVRISVYGKESPHEAFDALRAEIDVVLQDLNALSCE